MALADRIALVAVLVVSVGCSSDSAPHAGSADAGDASSPSTPGSAAAPEGGSLETWRCTTTDEQQPDAAPDIAICTCSRFAVPVDTSGATPACAEEPCCIADGPDDCDCFSASYPQAMDCDALVDQTNALETAQGSTAQAKRVARCPL